MKKIIQILILSVVPFLANGQVIFSEIMYDLEGSDINEWIEIQNIGTSNVDISTWKLFENNVNHTLKIFNGDIVLPPQGFAIIANDANAFLNFYANYAGAVFDSVFSLSNSGETLVLRNDLNVNIDTLTYASTQGANGDGNTLQRIDNEWRPGTPTPGQQNTWTTKGVGSATTTTTKTVTTSTPSSNAAPKVLSIYTSAVREFSFEEPEFGVSAGPDRLAAVGNRLEFRAETVEKNLNELKKPTFTWTFGDGSIQYGQIVAYNFRHPGEYTVVVHAEKGKYDADGHHDSISVAFSDDTDGWINVQSYLDPDGNFNFSHRFRAAFGGGRSPRVRNALLVLALAIKLDNAKLPDPESDMD